MVNFKLITRWLLSISGLYILWFLSYFILAKYALTELSNLRYQEGGISKAFSSDRLFWYFIYFGAIAFIIYLTRLLINQSPKPVLAAAIYASLVILSGGVLIYSLSAQSSGSQLLAHILINLCFIAAVIPTLLNHKIKQEHHDAHYV